MSYDTDWSLMDFGDEKKGAAPKAAPSLLPKGSCPKCGRHIGKGVGFHVKRCAGDNASNQPE